MIIRDYQPDDLAAVHRINNDAVPAVGEATPESLAHIASECSVALVACSSESADVIGFCFVLEPGADYGSLNYRWFGERFERFIYLDRVAITESARGLGVGHLLYDEVERRAGDLRPRPEVFALEVNIEPRNDHSLAFHDKRGFGEVGTRDTDYGVRVVMLTRSLS